MLKVTNREAQEYEQQDTSGTPSGGPEVSLWEYNSLYGNPQQVWLSTCSCFWRYTTSIFNR